MTEPSQGTSNLGGGTKGLCFPLLCITLIPNFANEKKVALPQGNFLFKVVYHHIVQSHPPDEVTESRLEKEGAWTETLHL